MSSASIRVITVNDEEKWRGQRGCVYRIPSWASPSLLPPPYTKMIILVMAHRNWMRYGTIKVQQNTQQPVPGVWVRPVVGQIIPFINMGQLQLLCTKFNYLISLTSANFNEVITISDMNIWSKLNLCPQFGYPIHTYIHILMGRGMVGMCVQSLCCQV